jgi:hypothetical protein
MAATGEGGGMFTLAAIVVRMLVRLFGDVRRNVVAEPYPSEEAQQSESYADDMV